MTDVVWRMSFVGGDWDGRDQLVPDVHGRPQSRFLAPFFDGVAMCFSTERPTTRTPYIACLLYKNPVPQDRDDESIGPLHGPIAFGYVYATADLLRAWQRAGCVDDATLDLMAITPEEVP
jgi:hypothetical protein